jgi:hypothetical protein
MHNDYLDTTIDELEAAISQGQAARLAVQHAGNGLD